MHYRIIMVVAAGLLAVGCGSREDVRVLRLAHGLDSDHPVHKAMEYMGERMSEKSGGRLKLMVFPSEQLGSERECIEQVQMGCLDMTKTSTSPMESFIPAYSIFSMPYLFRDNEHFWKVLNGPTGEELLRMGESVGLLGLCYYDAGSRSFYAHKPITQPADLEGLKIRVQQSKTSMDMISSLGGSPTPVSWGELYTALQQGVVDGAENNPPSFHTSRHYEVCKHFSLDEHTMVPDLLLISHEVWKGFDQETRRIVKESAMESSRYQRKLWAEATAEALEVVKSNGVEIHHPDKTAFQNKVEPMYAQAPLVVRDMLEQIQELGEQ